MPLLLASQGAKFMATIKKANGQYQASYEITLRRDDKTETETNVQTFDSVVEADTWLNAEAKLRGFN